MIIRMACEKDSERLLEIYSKYIRETVITFEYVIPDIETFKSRIRSISAKYPYLVCEDNGIIVGYAYASPHKEREAFKWCLDTSIYIDEAYHGKNIGRVLYDELIRLVKLQGIYKLYAVVCIPNEKSERFHKRMGFESVAVFNNVGFKLGEWRAIEYLELILNDNSDIPEEPKMINEVIDLNIYKREINNH